MDRSVTSLGLLGAALGALSLVWINNGQGVVGDDHDRHIAIPNELVMPIQVRAAYDGERILFQYRWPAERPGIHMDVYRYEGGEWVKYGEDIPGAQEHPFLEDRVAMMVDDGSVPEFSRYGGYITIGDGLDGMTDAADEDEVEAHPWMGAARKQDVVTKYLPQTRKHPGEWGSVVAEERLNAQREAGYFLDFWHWRGHRGNVMGFADDQYIADIRGGDSGRSGWSTNWDADGKHPKFMYDPARTGRHANKWDDLVSGRVGQDDIYYLSPDTMVEFDPDHAWQEGDTLPRRLVRNYEGSRADILTAGRGRWENGFWEVTLERLMDTGNPLEDKIFREGGVYDIAMAVHRHATGLRWHYVSLPLTVGLGREATVIAERFAGAAPAWNQPWHTVKLFYPGQVNWPLLISQRHAGKPMIERGVPVKHYHNEEQLARYGIEIEFDEPIRSQWRLTLLAGLFMFVGVGFGLTRLQRKN
ncbi:MAG TPA: ethylbenzene dehydrogenase-related protein [Azoarcus taiwanensis]|nr:ethylbenzene dehydrogenase-related protein [Azoarcus taiwanensis]